MTSTDGDQVLDAFHEAERAQRRRGQPCGIAALLDRLDDDKRQALAEALARDVTEISHKAVEVVVTEQWGETTTRNIVGHHRNGGCSCGR